mmetsp:Transcript_8456/g.13381  ORF Transcript_8456/g.13381 Transcript_8456/m.13381 type:complete len:109 (-) Transcript_8456:397-723(-)
MHAFRIGLSMKLFLDCLACSLPVRPKQCLRKTTALQKLHDKEQLQFSQGHAAIKIGQGCIQKEIIPLFALIESKFVCHEFKDTPKHWGPIATGITVSTTAVRGLIAFQ